MTEPIARTAVDRWHAHLRGELAMEEVLHPDVVFRSPVVFRPQEGRELTMLYLQAAKQVFPGDEPSAGGDGSGAGDGGVGGGFRYVKEIVDGHHAVLEFETTMGGVWVNGVDMITCDDDGRITEFTVMVRPRKAMETVWARMAAMLESMQPDAG